jgi:hypothetical protein
MAELHLYELYAIRYATATRNHAEVFIGGDPHAEPHEEPDATLQG